MTDPLVARTEDRDYQRLFLQDLHWSAPDHPPVVYDHDGRSVTATNVSSFKGLRVWAVNEKPESKLEADLDRLLAQNSTDRIVIFYDDTTQVWRWPARRVAGNSTATRLSRHRHTTGSADPTFAAKLDVIRLPHDRGLNVNEVVAKVREAFDTEAQNETKAASKLMARMYTAMTDAYAGGQTSAAERDHQISVTLARLLFLMFGDDTDMWRPNLFRDYIYNHTEQDGSDIGQRITDLFAHLDTSDADRPATSEALADFPYVNGGIFEEALTLPAGMTAEFRTVVLEACDRDWAAISPAIFGSMFQSVRDAETRRQLGEHYTSEENILKTLNPLFLDELRAEFNHIKTLDKYEADRLRKLRDKLGRIRYMDPACGCGNFIIVAYRELRDLELAIMERLQEITGDNPMLLANVGLKVTLDHFYGIEIDEWPARIAETAMFLVDRQCDLKLTASLGHAPDRLPIQEQATIVGDNALALDWTEVCPPGEDTVVAGNPPFLGISLRSEEQTEDLKLVWGSQYHGTLDYVTGWYAKAADYFGTTDGQWAFVSTSSITQGEAVAPLFQPILSSGWRIKFAHRTFPWTSEAVGKAAVHCVIIGFSRVQGKGALFDYDRGRSTPVAREVSSISPYLIDGPPIIVLPATKPLNPQLGEVAYGNKPTDGGYLIVKPEDYDEAMSDKVAAQYVRRYVGARELLHGQDRYCLWLTDLTPGDIERSRFLRTRLSGVEEFRTKSKAASTKEAAATPHLFRQIAQPDTSYLCIPAHVSEARPYFLTARFGPEVIASNANFLTPDADGFMFSIISSTMFLTWQRTVGGRLESRLRFNKLLTWNTFPLPSTDESTRRHIIDAGAEVLRVRAQQPDVPLADLYDPSSISPELVAAHAALDTEVDRQFGLKRGSHPELERQEVLFVQYQELAAPLLAAVPSKRRKRSSH